MSSNTGRGIMEYLIILAVIVVVALAVTGILGFFPGLGTGVEEQQSRSYWQNALPLSIVDWRFSSVPAEAVFSIQNRAAETIRVTEITIDGVPMGVFDADIALGAIAAIKGVEGKACVSGRNYEYRVVIEYSIVGGAGGKTQTGAKPVVGKCQ